MDPSNTTCRSWDKESSFTFCSWVTTIFVGLLQFLCCWLGRGTDYRGFYRKDIQPDWNKTSKLNYWNIHTYGHRYHRLLKSCRLVLSLCRVILKLKVTATTEKECFPQYSILMMCTIFSNIFSCKTFFEISFMCSVNLLSVLIVCHRGDI